MDLSSSTWDRFVYHRILPLVEAVAVARGTTAEHLALGRGPAVFLARCKLVDVLAQRAGWPVEAGWELFSPAGGLVPRAPIRPRPPVVLRLQPITPAEARRRRTAAARSTFAAMEESAWECSERAA